MSTPAKRARENKKARKKQDKAERRRQKREEGPGEIELTTAEEVTGPMRSIEEVMREMQSGGGPSSARSAAAIPVKLFVGGLSYDTNDESLRKAFEEFGEVLEAVVINDRDTGQSRGFGFVTMADRKDGPKAIKAMDGADLDGRTIAVNVASGRR